MKILFVSVSRSDFSIMSSLIEKIKLDNFFKFHLLITGEHSSREHGYTFQKIKKKFKKKSSFIKINDTKLLEPFDIVNKSSIILKKINFFLNNNKPDAVFLIGDRYETFLISYIAYVFKIPIVHIHGGEKTSGSLDDNFRHSISKMSNLHFVDKEVYKKRLIQIGENKKNIHVVGSLARENIDKSIYLKKKDIEKKFNFKFLKKNLIFTFHPEHDDISGLKKNINIILNSFLKFKDIFFIITAPNLDVRSNLIKEEIVKFSKKNKNSIFIPSLGEKFYFSFLKYCDGVIGNSSSGMIEVPHFNKFTINIGNRQSGRYMYPTVINTKIKYKEIISSINKAYSSDFIDFIKSQKKNKIKTSDKIIKVLKKVNLKKLLQKEFVDL